MPNHQVLPLLLAFHGPPTQATLRDPGSGLSSSTEPCLALPTAQCPQLRVVFCLQVLPQGLLSDPQEKAQTEQQGLEPRLQGPSGPSTFSKQAGLSLAPELVDLSRAGWTPLWS